MNTNPFAVLGIAPTRDLSIVKRAWFTALAKHPPHTDPEGFRIHREAYERLSNPIALAAAFVAAPLDVEALEREYANRFDARIDAHVRTFVSEHAASVMVQQFIERFSSMHWEDALRAVSSP